jgi:threonine synthase
MSYHSFLSELRCSSCGKAYAFTQRQTYCTICQAPLLPGYDIDRIANLVDRGEFRKRTKSIWRWFELLPVIDERNVVSLGEGDTPLLRLNRISEKLGIPNLYMKDEAQNPTGSFKARGISVAISKAVELGITKIVMPSAGNAGGALAAYAARAGIQSLIYMPKNTPMANIIESRITGAEVRLVDGSISEAGKFAREAEISDGWFNLATFKEPYRVEGKKIMGYEIAESFEWALPDAIIYPTGGGTGLIGMWKAFQELEKLGWLERKKMPKMISVQAEGCAPIVKAYHSNQTRSEYFEHARTIASGLCVPHSFADQLILADIKDSGGIAISVSDAEMLNARESMAKEEGILMCPEGAATYAALTRLQNRKIFHYDEKIVLFNTGSGLKYM